MEANVVRGHLEVHDEKGSYRIPVGRRSRKCLIILDQKEGEYIRSLELDLFTGFVYYCVDNATSGGLSYYYDMSSKKVSRYFVHRYLRLARNHGVTVSPEENEVFEKLPCDDWVTEVEKLPGWKEAIDHRMERLLLPETDVVKIPASANPGKEKNEAGRDFLSGISSMSFFRAPSAYPAREKEYTYVFRKSGEDNLLLHRDDTIGNAFFGEDVEFERILSEDEYAWLGSLLSCLAPKDSAASADAAAAVMHQAEQIMTADVMSRLFPMGEEIVLQRALICYQDGRTVEITSGDSGKIRCADIAQTALRGILRREIEIV